MSPGFPGNNESFKYIGTLYSLVYKDFVIKRPILSITTSKTTA